MPKQSRLFVSCILALVTVAFGFVIRAFVLRDWGILFNLTESQKGSLQGAGLYPQALSILFFSLVIDKLGYGRTIAFAFLCHVVSAIITISATTYTGLYVGTFVFALAGGAVEAVINPITATLYPESKTRHLNILHAGWPVGMVIGGLLTIALGGVGGPHAWRWKVALYLLPTAVYGWMMWREKFPVQERVAAGVPYLDMLREFGWAGCLIVSIFAAYALDEILRVDDMRLPAWGMAVVAITPTLVFGFWVRSFGRPLFIFLMGVMILLATTELGTDSWIADLMTPVLKDFGANAGNWVVIYVATLMVALRFCAGPIGHFLSPLGLLTVCSAVAACGLFWLAHAGSAAFVVFLAATLYGCGKTFFWPTTLAVVSEQFPKGGALTISSIAAVGTISVGVLGSPLLGTVQDYYMDKTLAAQNPALYAKVADPAESKYGLTYQPLDNAKIEQLTTPEKAEMQDLRAANNQFTLGRVAILPTLMFLCFFGLLLYFRARGGYRPVRMTV